MILSAGLSARNGGRFWAGAESVHAQGDGGNEHHVAAEQQQRMGHPVTMEVDDVAQGSNRGAGP